MRAGRSLLNPADVQPAGRAGRRQGPWWRPGSRGGCVSPPRSVARPHTRSVLAGPQVAIAAPPRNNCSVYGGWRHHLEVRFCHVFRPPRLIVCSNHAFLPTVSMQTGLSAAQSTRTPASSKRWAYRARHRISHGRRHSARSTRHLISAADRLSQSTEINRQAAK